VMSRRDGGLEGDVIVLGGGAAGLAAARGLGVAGRHVVLVEARTRLGGRILTVREPGWPLAVELGAEFLHGRATATMDVVRGAGRQDPDSRRQQRLPLGYDTLVDWLASAVRAAGGDIRLGTAATAVAWRRRRVEVECRPAAGGAPFTLRARAAVVTLPSAVL